MRLLFDIEANELLEKATKMHCIVAKDIDTKEVFKFYGDQTVAGDHGSLDDGVWWLGQAEELIGHNIIGYDVPLVRKLYDVDLRGKHMVDTLALSKTLNADRPIPMGMPSPVNPLTGKKERYGPHSLGAWGFRLGRFKPEWHDWAEFSPGMLHRCAEDVEINYLVYLALMKELNGLKQ